MVNLLPNANDHSLWTDATGFTSGQTDRFGGSTAEAWTEHSGFGDSPRAEMPSIALGPGRYIAELYYKALPGSNPDRQIEMDIWTAVTQFHAIWIYGDKDGNVLGVRESDPSPWIVHSATITPAQNGFYRMTLDFTTSDANVAMWIGFNEASVGAFEYVGDGVSGWLIDDHRIYAYGTVIDDGETVEETPPETPSTGAGSATGQSWRQKYDHLPKYTGSWERKEEYSDRLLDEMDRLYRARDEEEAIVAILLSGL